MANKFLDIKVLNYSISTLAKMIDKTFLKKSILFDVTPETYRLFDPVNDNVLDKLTVVDNNTVPSVGEVTSDTVRYLNKDANVYKVGAEVIHVNEILVPKFDNIKGISEADLTTLKADTKANRQTLYKSNVLFVIDDSKLEFYDRNLDSFTEIKTGSYVPEWEDNVSYVVGDKVKHNNVIYECILDHTSADFDLEKDNWITLLEHYYALTQQQYDDMVSNGLITDENSYLYVVSDGTPTPDDSYEMDFTKLKDIKVQHNLNCKYPLIRVFDANDNELYMDIEYYSDNLTILHSEVEISGKVIVNKL